MLENFIYAKQKSLFETALNNGEVLDEAIVFIEDTKEIWNHGTYFDGNAINLKTINGKSILGEGDLITDIVVKSVEELNSLDVPIGTKARIFNEVPETVYEGLNLGRILSGTETNPLPPDLYENFNKYTFDIEIDTNVSFPYYESALHIEVALPTHNSIYVYIGQNYTSISRIDIKAGFRENLYASQNWYSCTHYLHSFSFEELSNMSVEQIETLFAISSAFNGSITVPAYVAVDDYVKTSEGWVSPLNNLNNLINNITLFIPTKTSQLENDLNFVSSDGLKTINGESIVGSGDIVIQGGSSEANVLAVDIIGELDELEVPIILIEPTEESIILYDKLIVIITNPTHYIDVEFADGINAHAEYTLLFQTDDSLGTLLLPEEVQWVNGEIPTLEANCNYELSVVKTSYNESNLIYKAIITKFTSL